MILCDEKLTVSHKNRQRQDRQVLLNPHVVGRLTALTGVCYSHSRTEDTDESDRSDRHKHEKKHKQSETDRSEWCEKSRIEVSMRIT